MLIFKELEPADVLKKDWTEDQSSLLQIFLMKGWLFVFLWLFLSDCC